MLDEPTFEKNTGSLQREFHKFSGKSRLVIFFRSAERMPAVGHES